MQLSLLDPQPAMLGGEQCELVFFWLKAAQCERDRGEALRYNQRSEAAGELSVRHQLRGGSSQWSESPLSLGLKMRAGPLRMLVLAGNCVRGQEEIEVLRRDGVYWVRVDDSGNAGAAVTLCPFPAEVDDEPARQVRSKKIPVFPGDGTPSAHRMAPTRPWREVCHPVTHCVKGFAMEDRHRRQNRSHHRQFQEVQLDYMFLVTTTAGRNSTKASSTCLPSCTLLTMRRSCP